MKVVISASVRLQAEIHHWENFFKEKGCEILDVPKPVDPDCLLECYPEIYRNFMESITKADLLFVMNEDRDGIPGYIGAQTFAELSFGLTRRTVDHQKIDLVLLKMPDPRIHCFEEVSLWHRLGWIKILGEEYDRRSFYDAMGIFCG